MPVVVPGAAPSELIGRRPEPQNGQGCLHELFAAGVQRWPDRVAVADGVTTLSYRELDLAANRLAHKLVRMGAGPEHLVAVCADCTADAITAVLGVLKSGAGYLPLDPRHPAARLDQTLTDAGCQVLVGHQDLCAPLARPGRAIIWLRDPLTGEPGHPPRTTARPANIAYVIYTSGSTGTPKGVMVSHANVTRLFTATREEFRPGPGDVWTLFHSLAFDFSVWEIWGALLHGGKLVIVPHLVRCDPAAFLDLLRTEQVTVLNQTPTAFSQLTDAVQEAGYPPLALRLIIFGGEALDPSRLRRWASGYGTASPALVNMYGITETTVHVTLKTITADDLTSTASPIGQPIRDLRLSLLTPAMTQAPPRTEAEICVGGPGVARGYLNRPALTAERFIPDPYGPPGARLYRADDRAVRLPDGDLEFRGRGDSQVKLHGYRIELGEIEHALLDQPGIRAAVCTLREDTPGQPRIIAYLVPDSANPPDPGHTRGALHARLPDYMIPAGFVTLPGLPLTTNGKLDHTHLPPPLASDFAGPPERVRPPRSQREELLCDVFAEVLGVQHVGVDNSFFEMGGDSLLAGRLASRIRSVLGVDLEIRQVFDHPTVAELTSVLYQGTCARKGVVRAPRSGTVPLSFAQSGLWVLHQQTGGGAVCNVPVAWRLRGELDRAALADALGDVAGRHEVLRTLFPEADGQLMQQVLEGRAARPDLTSVRTDAAGLAGALAEAARYEFDLSGELPVRAWLFELGRNEYVLMVLMHHIVSDGWSIMPLARDLSVAYAARRAGIEPAWASLPVRYADYVLWQRELLGSEYDPESLICVQADYWRTALEGTPRELQLPADRVRPAVPSYHGGSVPVLLDATAHTALLTIARECRATLFMVMQAGVAALLTRMGAGTDIPFGSVVAGRGDSGLVDEALTDLVGCFVNPLVLRIDTSLDPSFRELVRRVRESDLAAYAHQDIPFGWLVKILNPPRSMTHHPFCQVALDFQDYPLAVPEFAGLKIESVPLDMATARFDLTFMMRERRDSGGAPAGVEGAIEYSVDLFDRITVGKLAARLARLLETVTADPDQPIGRL